ncbi:MAG: plasma-membrane proton-efflux P-type ATPase [Acidimicrobiaceae bacterium]|nr:plasma-membrane proton-efflux P-type ATPase [Acidimicrobiaceae bacterium]
MSENVRGLSAVEAARRLAVNGPNAIAEVRENRLAAFAQKFWAPVPWLLEVTVVLELILGNLVQAGVFALLLVFNAVLSATQEGRAQVAVDLLRARLDVNARVLRDGQWTLVRASELVVGDVVHVRQGDLVPADLTMSDGLVELDQSALTGESQSKGVGPGEPGYSGSVVVKGEATGEVGAVGAATYFGRTAQLVSAAQAPGNMERLVFGVVRALMGFALLVVVLVGVDGIIRATPLHELVPFVLILVIASVPVALPATFTLATALGSREMSQHRVLVTRLAAIEEAASMEVLCTDKTGTLTQNVLVVESLWAQAPFDEDHVLQVAAAASDAATEDPLDLAVLKQFSERQLPTLGPRVSFTPFDPATKHSESVVTTSDGALRVVKGAPQIVAALANADVSQLAAHVDVLAASGARVLGVAEGPVGESLRFVGLVGLSDPARDDAPQLVENLHRMGIHVVMLTGDSLATARAIASRVGIGERVGAAEALRSAEAQPVHRARAGDERPWDHADWKDVYAEVLSEDKMRLIASLQAQSIVVGMTGDGVNDAPALKSAEVGVAVSSATDVAKAAASLVLIDPGLANMVSAVEVSRRIHQRMLTYTLNKVIKTLQISVFLGVGFVVYGRFVTTPTLVVLMLLANDFPTMSLATDHVRSPNHPQRWRVGSLIGASLGFAGPLVLLSFALWWFATVALHLDLAQMQTMVFVWLVCSGQATIYLVREREHFWHSRPSTWLAVSSVIDLVVVVLLALSGLMMSSIGAGTLAAVIGLSLAYLVVVDQLKSTIFRLAHFGR